MGETERERTNVFLFIIKSIKHELKTRPSQVYLEQNKKKAEAKGKKCHAKTMWSLEKPI
jgi:hypothetical protein